MDSYIVGAERIDGAKTGAVYRVPAAPWRFVFHTTNIGAVGTTDAWSRSRCRDYAAAHENPPHLWAAYHHDWVGQTVPLTLSAYALRHNRGDPETNHAHAIQVEVFGYAERGLTDPGLCDWLGRRVLGPVLAAGIPIDLTNLAPSDGPDAYGLNGSVRQSWAWWAGFDGVCGHQNVPGNVHWDPGRSDYARIARAAQPQEDWFAMATQADLVTAVRAVLDSEAKKVPGIISWERYLEVLLEAARTGARKPSAEEVAAAVVAALPGELPDGVDLADIEQAVRHVFADAGVAP